MTPPGPEDGRLPRVGISSCLLGENVRHDGGHKRAPDLIADLGRTLEWVAVCPELEVGMGVPREPVDLVGEAAGGPPRLLGAGSGKDWTAAMESFSARRLDDLERLGLSGYVLKSRSPSCGLAVPVRSRNGEVVASGEGLFAAALRRRFPDLPIAEECGLADPASRRAFLARVIEFHGRLRGRRATVSP